MVRWRRIWLAALWAVWLVSRARLYLLVTAPHMNGDVGIYQHWYACCLSRGAVPAADQMWQYPPGAALVLWLPGALPGGYVTGFVLLAIGCDLAVTLLLCARARRGGSLAGAWYWACGVPLLGAVAITRFDVVPVALSVAALTLGDRGHGGLRGALTGAGAAVKIWPAALLAGTPPGQLRRNLAAGAAAFAAVCVPFAGATASFLAHQAARGLEVESVAATPLMVGRLAGWPAALVFRYGSYQLSGGHAAIALDASRIAVVLTVAAVAGWRLLAGSRHGRWRPEFAADAPLAATLLFLVASPVLSAQYLLWATGLAAVCLAADRTTQRPAAIAVLAAAGLTQVVFPVAWPSLLAGSGTITAVLAVRNLLLVAAAALSCRPILRASWPADETPSGQREEDASTRLPAAARPQRPGAADVPGAPGLVALAPVGRSPAPRRARDRPPAAWQERPCRASQLTSGFAPGADHRPMCVFVIEVNWQISAADSRTRPIAISLKRRSSRPLAANANMTSAPTVRTRARASMRSPVSQPQRSGR